ncbi:DEAD/DEAH box helicase [Accumulibacter sp.]|uniref:DEAD/DEAH box helicase n=1 Tax=Accumulibacter sp. TaxID=2053492 RepID=UPI00258ED863|nr:DEAD/DEAH box helicase [Accumulibacter sp.]
MKRTTSTLPPSLAYGRGLAHLFMARLCAIPDLESQWASAELPAPRDDLARLAAAAPPLTGAEYLDLERLEVLWADLRTVAREKIAAAGGSPHTWLKDAHPSWNLVGRVCFHLAENKNDERAPFAFLATYAARLSRQATVQHRPLAGALQEYAGAGERNALLGLLLPIQKAAEHSPWLKSLVDSGAIFHPLAWTPAEAYRFLQDVPAFEASGVVVRIPDWWRPRLPPRPQIDIRLGHQVAGLGLAAMMDFRVDLTLDGEALSDEEWQQVLAAGEGLMRLKGRWVEVDREKLQSVLEHWQEVRRSAGEGISFLQGMRLLAGATLDGDAADDLPAGTAEWSKVIPGEWMRGVLEGLRGTQAGADPGPELKAQLRPYQQAGVHWLWWLNRLGLGGCLADDMGLGKTVQVLGLLLLLKREGDPGPHLLVLPASLIANWQAEIERFAPTLRTLIAHASALPAGALATLSAAQFGGDGGVDLVITSYGTLARTNWMAEVRWSLVVLDEAQAIKNPGTRQTRAVKRLPSRVRLALTGTPVENRLGDLWSLFDFICPGLLGSAQAFSRFARRLAEDEQAGYAPLRKLVQPYILRRLKSDRQIIADLPDKTELKAYCPLTQVQAALYQESVATLAQQIETLDGIQRRGVVLAFLMRFKQICNHPSQWLGDGAYLPGDSGKFSRLRELAEAIAARQEKVLVFTQFQEMTGPLAGFLQEIFGRPGLVLHGGTPVKARQSLVEAFQREFGPPFFVLSLKAGGTGLNLTAAAHVIHFDRWWNPAVENQATDRAYRIGQKKNVLVHKFICRGTVEEKIDALIETKLGLSNEIVEGGAETLLTEMSSDDLLRLVSLDLERAIDEI